MLPWGVAITPRNAFLFDFYKNICYNIYTKSRKEKFYEENQ